jgi:hypothetical protein
MKLQIEGAILLAALAAFTTACTVQTTVDSAPAPEPEVTDYSPSTAATLKVPPGHLPPPGKCRIWIPGDPPGHQPKARSCDGIDRRAPAGSWILYRPGKDKKVVHVREVDARRTGVIVRIRIYEAASGRFIRETAG